MSEKINKPKTAVNEVRNADWRILQDIKAAGGISQDFFIFYSDASNCVLCILSPLKERVGKRCRFPYGVSDATVGQRRRPTM